MRYPEQQQEEREVGAFEEQRIGWVGKKRGTGDRP